MAFNTLHLAIILFLVVGIVFAIAPILISLVIAPSSKGGGYKLPYECGMVPHGTPWGNFSINYYVYALIFISFDVDILYLFPAAAFYKYSVGYLALIELSFFLFFVVLAIFYFRAKGVFEWPSRIKI